MASGIGKGIGRGMTGGGYEEFEGYRGGGGYYGKIIKAFLMAHRK